MYLEKLILLSILISRRSALHLMKLREEKDQVHGGHARQLSPPKAADVAISATENATGIQPTSDVASENIVATTGLLPALPSGT